MSGALLDIFPGLSYKNIRTINIEARFTASIGGGATQFDFGSSGGLWASFNALNVDPKKFYYMDYLTIGANLNPDDFTDAIDITFNPNGFDFDIFQTLQNSSVLLKPFTFSTLRQNVPMNIWWGSSRGQNINNEIQPYSFRIRGSIEQTAAVVLLGIVDLSILIQTTIYEIDDANYIAKYFGGRG